MPEYLAPGVYVEEVSYRSKSIEGVSTTTTGFVGPTRSGVVNDVPEVLTSLSDFEATYGDGEPLGFAPEQPNHLWQAARAFFEQGGKRLYVKRVIGDGAQAALATAGSLSVAAASPGTAGERNITIELRAGANALGVNKGVIVAPLLRDGDVVWLSTYDATSIPSPADYQAPAGVFATVTVDPVTKGVTFTTLHETIDLHTLVSHTDPTLSDQVRVVTAALVVQPRNANELAQQFAPYSVDAGRPDSLQTVFAPGGDMPFTVTVSAPDTLLQALLANQTPPAPPPPPDAASPPQVVLRLDLELGGGDDGAAPSIGDYDGSTDPAAKRGLIAFEDIPEISIVAAPGSSYSASKQVTDDIAAIQQALIGHAEHMRYRIAVLDSVNGLSIGEVGNQRGSMDSSHAALYYPWIKVMDPVSRQPIFLPPSGFVAGIYARNDVERAVYKAPANEVITGAIGFERMVNFGEQEVLNPQGVNCLRALEGRGLRVWGARTISSDPEWKYVNLRRYFAYLERSIDVGTQWAVFEPNGERLWDNVRRTVASFLFSEFHSGALLGAKPEEAYFVRCDRSTMDQNDLDNGRLVCLVGVAALRPAEFVIFRIGQWTADATA